MRSHSSNKFFNYVFIGHTIYLSVWILQHVLMVIVLSDALMDNVIPSCTSQWEMLDLGRLCMMGLPNPGHIEVIITSVVLSSSVHIKWCWGEVKWRWFLLTPLRLLRSSPNKRTRHIGHGLPKNFNLIDKGKKEYKRTNNCRVFQNSVFQPHCK